VNQLNILRQGEDYLLFLVSAPSSCGKSSLVQKVISYFPNQIFRSVTCTTRVPRGGEKHGEDYWFMTVSDFKEKKRSGDFLECANVYGNWYGSLREDIFFLRKKGHVVLVLDIQGIIEVQRQIPEAISIFLEPPSMDELSRRAYKRGEDAQKEIEIRLSQVLEELKAKALFDYIVVNDIFSVTSDILRSIIIAESVKNRRK